MGYSEALEQQASLVSLFERQQATPAIPSEVMHFGDEMKNALFYGETFYWASSVIELIDRAAAELTSFEMSEQLLPSRSGFSWFDRNISVGVIEAIDGNTVYGTDVAFRSLCWHINKTGVSYSWLSERFGDKLSLSGRTHILYGVWRWGESISQASKGARIRHVYFKKDSIQPDISERFLGWLASALLFIHQRILIAPQQRAERHARKRIEQQGYVHEPLIRVVELRRKQSKTDRVESGELVDWSCQWINSGHWRQQACGPGWSERRPKWIMPYVKGPEDKPLKPPRAKVFAVVR